MKASRSTRLRLTLDFRTKAAIKRSITAYAAEIIAGRSRTGMTLQDLAKEAGVSPGTVWNHEAERIRSPQIRTMASILFACGFHEITFVDPAFEQTLKKVA